MDETAHCSGRAGGTRFSQPGTESLVTHPESTRRALSLTTSGMVGTLLLLIVAGLCVRLGFWQLDRLEQRRERNALIESRLAEASFSLEYAPHDTSGLSFRRVHVRGTFDNDRSVVLPGRSLRGAPGVHLLTPLQLEDGSAVLVNRGWVRSPDAASIDLTPFDTVGAIAAGGMILPFPGAESSIGRAPDDAATLGTAQFQRIWFRIDPVILRAQYPYPIAGFVVQLLPEPGAPLRERGAASQPVRLEPPVLDEGPHLGYALQWFSFAAIAVIGWVALVVRHGGGEPDRRVAPPT